MIGGIVGVAIATVVCHIVSMTISFIKLKKSINLKFSFIKFVLKPLLANCIMGISSIYFYDFFRSIITNNIAIIVTIIFATLIYIISLGIIKVFDKEELHMIPYYSKFVKNTTK